eukprot:TRINITY_DN4873_c1_g1_i1.p1 TRINITY_DN4873_c1_g1~~TRINITY_DN4873_c1_g1_i1.p1  ORF type:complete len:968 (+),score=181.92 TRINITY_DN4873_c1_g1_i1:69-2972(+)
MLRPAGRRRLLRAIAIAILSAAASGVDECGTALIASVCENAVPEQICNDPFPATMDDWVCQCKVGYGSKVADAAYCLVPAPPLDLFDECSECHLKLGSANAGNSYQGPVLLTYPFANVVPCREQCQRFADCAAYTFYTAIALVGANSNCAVGSPCCVWHTEAAGHPVAATANAEVAVKDQLTDCAVDPLGIAPPACDPHACVDPTAGTPQGWLSGDWLCRCLAPEYGFATLGVGLACSTPPAVGDVNECDGCATTTTADLTGKRYVQDVVVEAAVWAEAECFEACTGMVGCAAASYATAASADVASTHTGCVKDLPCCLLFGASFIGTAPVDDPSCVSGPRRDALPCAVGVCQPGPQECFDTDPASPLTWECRCNGGALGATVGLGRATCVVPTSAPPLTTPAPSTPFPGTSTPGTPTPGTPAPLIPTSGPVVPSDAPLSVAPLDAPEEDVAGDLSSAQKEAAAKVSAVAGVAAMAGGGAGAMAGFRLAVARDMACDVDDVDLNFNETLDFEFHPSTAGLGGHPARYLIGAVVLNHVLVFGFGSICLSGAWWLRRQRGEEDDPDGMQSALAWMKIPGVLIVPTMFLLPGTGLTGARLLFFPHLTDGWAALGALGLLSCAAGLFYVGWIILRQVPRKARLMRDPRLYPEVAAEEQWEEGDAPEPLTGPFKVIYRLSLGEVIWVTEGGGYFADKYGLIFDSYREGLHAMLLVEISLNVFLALLSAWKPQAGTACNLRNTIISVSFTAFFIAVLWLRPFSALIDNLAVVLIASTTAVAFAAMTIGIWAELDPNGAVFGLAGVCLYGSAVFLIAKGVWDIVWYIIDLLLSRRASARSQARQVARSPRAAPARMMITVTDGEMWGVVKEPRAPSREHSYGDLNLTFNRPPASLVGPSHLRSPLLETELFSPSQAAPTFNTSTPATAHLQPSREREVSQVPSIKYSRSTQSVVHADNLRSLTFSEIETPVWLV